MLTGVSAVVLVVQLFGRHASSWHYFHLATELLRGEGPGGSGQGVHLYRDHPELQFGPLSILASLPFTILGETGGGVAATIVLSAIGLVAFGFVVDAIDRLAPGLLGIMPRWAWLLGGGTFVITWGDLAVRTAHIDDGIVWLSVAVAMWSSTRGRGLAVAIAIAIAAAAKPWAIMFAPLVLVVPGRWRLGGLAVIGGFVALTWAPFILAEPDTLSAAEFDLAVDATSGLNVFGVDGATVPSWVRPVQVVGGMALVAALVTLRRWPAAVLVAVSWRLLLDPGARRYYVVGFVFGALIVELLARRGQIPWLTVAAAITLEVTSMRDVPTVPGAWIRVVLVVAAIVAGFTARRVARPSSPTVRAGRGALARPPDP